MPAWPGGPCPTCNEDMPANLLRCVNCRTMLNDELELESVEIPPYEPLKEIESCLDAKPRGYYVGCPHCHKRLRINAQYLGKRLNCRKCSKTFTLTLSDPKIKNLGFYLDCPSCEERLKVAQKYAGQMVKCKFCSSMLQFID
ncbi:hypothetical protein Pan258_35450 [Symmachiella dynata]|uniref:Double zinc ribbon n=2 Tax=Symmachiella dynata TaxID=2527995 RepID=A0A517ZRQ9_9PLAN|nr:hypothetical protein [Symmachiella dynata]QDT49495.1 hypothetical protein Pan258_35450 [Symmachiella dynata]QDU45148.1 hypothetical protein Mal52_36370 [Symmachiella dynata]